VLILKELAGGRLRRVLARHVLYVGNWVLNLQSFRWLGRLAVLLSLALVRSRCRCQPSFRLNHARFKIYKGFSQR